MKPKDAKIDLPSYSHFEPDEHFYKAMTEVPEGCTPMHGGPTVAWKDGFRYVADLDSNWLIVGSTRSGKSQGAVGTIILNSADAGG